MLALAAAGFALAGGVAVATTLVATGYVDSGGSYHGCVNATNGQLRVVEPGDACREQEVAIDWARGGSSSGTTFQSLDGTPCTLGGKSGTTALSQGDGNGTFFMNALCLVPDRFEPNDTAAGAVNLVDLHAYASFATLTPAGNDDWYSLPQTALYWMMLNNDAGLPGAGDFVAELYEDGTVVATGKTSATGSVQLSYNPMSGGAHDWLLHVTSPHAAAYNFSFGY